MKILRGIAILLAVLFIPAFAAAEDTQDAQEAESIMEVDYSGFQQVEPYIAYVKTMELWMLGVSCLSPAVRRRKAVSTLSSTGPEH